MIFSNVGVEKDIAKTKAPHTGNVIKLRKAGLHRNVRSSFFVIISEKVLDKQQKMCGLFAN